VSGWEGTKAMEDGERTPEAHILTDETGEREVVRWHSVTRLEGLILRWRHSNIYLAGCCKCLNGKERNLLRTVDVKEEGN